MKICANMPVRTIYYFLCLTGLVVLGSIRSAPIYGKMDFYLLPEAPWRQPWRPMIEKVLASGTRPIISDMITDTVLRGVFAQPSPGFRFDHRFSRIAIEELTARYSKPDERSVLPAVVYLLLAGETKEQQRRMLDTLSRLTDIILQEQEKRKRNGLRCVINLHDYPASWVPYETGHWSPLWSQPSHIYAFHGKRGKELRQLLRDSPPPGCMVFF